MILWADKHAVIVVVKNIYIYGDMITLLVKVLLIRRNYFPARNTLVRITLQLRIPFGVQTESRLQLQCPLAFAAQIKAHEHLLPAPSRNFWIDWCAQYRVSTGFCVNLPLVSTTQKFQWIFVSIIAYPTFAFTPNCSDSTTATFEPFISSGSVISSDV
ncbi:hypothetical protein PM082_020617 [Marasmius tenuissimus]|nr:hypothetical protein PM082_020617 [Marasmius tenuissimus]